MGIAAERECYSMHTSLGKEGAEAVVRVSGLALVGQVAIGLRDNASVNDIAQILGWKAYLNAVFEAVELLGRR